MIITNTITSYHITFCRLFQGIIGGFFTALGAPGLDFGSGSAV
jgi:hypothetical protein